MAAPTGTGALIEVAVQLVGVAGVPLKFTVPVVDPKFVPAIVIDVPTTAELGERLVMLGAATTVNALPLLATPPTVTTTFPFVAPAGTVVTIEVALQLVAVAVVVLNLIVPVAPKFVPVIVTVAPTAPVVIERLAMLGATKTVNAFPLLSTPLAWTTTLPFVAPAGTGTLIDVAVQLVGVEAVLLNFTVPVVVPKFVPAMVIDVPTTAELGERLVMLGAATTVNAFPLLATPPTVTTTFPFVAPAGTVVTIEVAFQLVVVASVVLNLTVPVVPKFVPVIVTVAPTAPEAGDKLLMIGAAVANVERARIKTKKAERTDISPTSLFLF